MCPGQFGSNGPDCQAEDSHLHLGARFNYYGGTPNQSVLRIEWKRDGALVRQGSVNVQFASGYVWDNFAAPTELPSGKYEAILYSENQERGRGQIILPPSVAQIQAKHQASEQELVSARQLFESRDYKGAMEAADRAIAIDPDNQDAAQLRQQILRTIEILGTHDSPEVSPAVPAGAGRNPVAAAVEDAGRLYRQRDYKAALAACDRALRSDPGNADATQLRNSIVQTMGILGIQ